MITGDKPDLLIFHGPACLDGWGSAWAIETRWPGIPTHVGVYGEAPPDVTGLNVLIADFSYPEDDLRAMAARAKGIFVLDHHATSAAFLPKLIEEGVIRGVHDQKRSGATLTYEYAFGVHAIMPKMLLHVQDRDLWKWEMEGTEEVTSVLFSWGPDLRAWSQIARDLENGNHAQIHAEGRAIKRQRDQDVAKIIAAGERSMRIGGYEVPVVNAPFFLASEVGHKLCVGQPFAATYMDLPNGRQFSLRSRPAEGGLNVNEIAEQFEGGGHAGAAGFMAPVGWEGESAETVEEITLKGRGTGVKVETA